VLAGNAQLTSLRKGTGRGFLLRLTVEGEKPAPAKPIKIPGHINRMKISPSGHPCLLIDNAGVYMLKPGTSKPVKSCSLRGILDFGVDSSGEIVVLHGRNMTRYDRTWKRRKWSVTWHAYGGNRPGGMAVCPKTGVAAVVGYGMTHTGREPWKDPYAYGFDRGGKQIWKLWDPKPSLQVSGSHGGNGLMADTTGKLARAGGDGKVYLSLYADGGNSVCTRDPADPDERIAPEVYEGVYGRMRPDEPAPTLTSGCIFVTRGPFGHPHETRAITPREAARLQTFPDDFAFCGYREEVARQIGNAIPVRLAEVLARSFSFD